MFFQYLVLKTLSIKLYIMIVCVRACVRVCVCVCVASYVGQTGRQLKKKLLNIEIISTEIPLPIP